MLRFLMVLAVAGTIMAGAFASAAGLGTVTAGPLGSDGVSVSGASGPVNVTYDTQLQDNLEFADGTVGRGFQVIAINVSGFGSTLNGSLVLVDVVSNVAAGPIGFGRGTVDANGNAKVSQWYYGGGWNNAPPLTLAAKDVNKLNIIVKQGTTNDG